LKKVGRNFDSLDDMKEFAKLLYEELMKISQVELAEEIKFFSYNTYTTSSEYLGELKFVLERILSEVNHPHLAHVDKIKDAILKGSVSTISGDAFFLLK
jgi:hypothetical protein